MTNDQLRQGAALCRCLVEGDETARGPLSDFILEHGLLLNGGPMSQSIVDDIALMLQNYGAWVEVWYSEWRNGPMIGTTRPGEIRQWHLGQWPAWAWEGREPTSEAS